MSNIRAIFPFYLEAVDLVHVNFAGSEALDPVMNAVSTYTVVTVFELRVPNPEVYRRLGNM